MKLRLSLHVINCIGQVLETRSFWAFWKRTLKFIVIIYFMFFNKRNSIQNSIQQNSVIMRVLHIVIIGSGSQACTVL